MTTAGRPTFTATIHQHVKQGKPYRYLTLLKVTQWVKFGGYVIFANQSRVC